MCLATTLHMEPPSAQSPFARCWRYPHRGGIDITSCGDIAPRSSLLLTHSPIPLPLLAFGLSLVPEVFAGCYQPLLPAGPSRRYLCDPFLGCLVPCHGGPTRCICLFLPSCHRPSPTEDGSACRLIPRTRLSTERFSRLQTFLYVQASELARLPGRSYRCEYSRRAAETFTSG